MTVKTKKRKRARRIQAKMARYRAKRLKGWTILPYSMSPPREVTCSILFTGGIGM